MELSGSGAYARGGRCSECGTSEGFNDYHMENKTTCSTKCRKRRERRLKQAKSAWVVVLRELQPVRDSIKRGEDLEEHREKLKRLRDEITDLLHLAKDNDTMEMRAMLEARKRQMNLQL